MIYNKFVNCQSTAVFDSYLASGEIVDQHVVFIMDTKQIWTHGVFYGGNQLTDDEMTALGALITDGDGNSVLTNDGTYKDISVLFSDETQTKLGVLSLDGDGSKFLANDGTYKELNAEPEIYIGDTEPDADSGATLWITSNEYDTNTMNIAAYNVDYSHVTTLANLPIAQSIYAELSEVSLLTLSGSIPVGCNMRILVKNVSSNTLNLPIPSSTPYINMGSSSLSIEPGKYAEINIWAYAEEQYSIRTGEML